MTLIYIQSNDLLEELVEGLIRMCDNQCSLVWTVVIDVGNDLDCNVRFSSTRWSNNLKNSGEIELIK